MKKLSGKNGEYYYSLREYSLLRVLSFERFQSYFLQDQGGNIALDYGAGDRPYEEMLRTKYVNYVAADHVVTHAKYYEGNTPDILLNGSSLPLNSASVDCAVLTEVLEHIYDPLAVLVELRRVLKPGGRLFGTVPFAIQQHDEPYDYHRYTYFCLQKLFVEAGFQIKNLDYVGDMVGVALTNAVGVFEVLPKALAKLHLGPIASVLRLLIRIPIFAYYYSVRAGLTPTKLSYFKRYPLGFSFCCIKPQS